MNEEVYITTINQYCKENGIKNISLLKIDVEGHEMDVLNGAKEIIETGKVEMISFEFGGCNIDTKTFIKNFWDFFDKNNYKLYRITTSGYLYPIIKYKEIYEQFSTTNFLALLK